MVFLVEAVGIYPKALNILGYTGVVYDIIKDGYENLIDGYSLQKTVAHGFVDASFAVGTMMATAATTTKVGAMAGGVAGAVAGFVVGIGVYVLTEVVTVNRKSVKDQVKDSINWLFGWD